MTMFNDQDKENVGKLQAAVDALPGIGTLKYKPQISNEIVGAQIAAMFAAVKMVPTFSSLILGLQGLIVGADKLGTANWGCDCVFFFNYNRINMGLANPAVRAHMDVLFGRERADKLRMCLPTFSNPKTGI